MSSSIAVAIAAAALTMAPTLTVLAQGAAPSMVVLADPQIHNVHGSGIKQTLGISDWFSGVAQRPPELNLLAPYVLEELAGRASTRPDGNGEDLVVVLGDTTNIGCTGEYDRFRAAVNDGIADDPLVLIAHGNHDSYLMGTVNSYVPGGAVEGWRPERMAAADLPVDESWWGDAVEPEDQQANTWKHICYQPESGSLPINKVQWLARYFESLRGHGLQMKPDGVDGVVRRFSSQVAPGSRLAALNYKARGQWLRPRLPPQGEPARESDLMGTYGSFVVQAFDLGPSHRVVLVDTSVCTKASGGPAYLWTNAGTNSCIGNAQLDAVKEVVGDAAGRQLVFAGHFPLAKMDERDALVDVMSDGGKRRWTYLSAHSHSALSISRQGASAEVNIGSTTDWPMEANRMAFHVGGGLPAVYNTTLSSARPVDYVPPVAYERSEMCRHLGAAQALASEDPGRRGSPWTSPGTQAAYRECEQQPWSASSAALAAAVAGIDARMEEPAYRQRMLEIAAAASYHEHLKNRNGISSWIP
jgi:hypothetical protein